jgi:peptidyl-prolyl cis-trans isomerase SurA
MNKFICFALPFLTVTALSIASPAYAQSIVATVNGTPVTSLEVSERHRFTVLTTKKDPGVKKVTEQLIEENLILQEARKRRISVDESDIDARFAGIAQNVKLSVEQLRQALAQAGASERTFKQNIRSQMMYRKLVTSQFNVANSVSEKDIAAQLAQLKGTGEKSYRYTLRQIIFVLPKNASPALVAQRMGQANALRGRFTTCEAGLAAAKGMRDVAVKDPVFRTSAQFSPGFAERVKKLNVGQATPAERGEQGVEIVGVCDRIEIRDDSTVRQKVQLELADQKLKTESERYLKSLRDKADVKYR